MPNRIRAALPAIALVLLLGACGDDDGGGGGVATATDATVSLASTSLGEVLVDGDGRTLYLFTNDAGDEATCTGGCATTWPALTAEGVPAAGNGVDGTKLATNADGHVTYAGHPLYRFAQDTEAGEVAGQGVGGVWFAVDAEGEPVRSPSTPSSTTGATVPGPSY